MVRSTVNDIVRLFHTNIKINFSDLRFSPFQVYSGNLAYCLKGMFSPRTKIKDVDRFVDEYVVRGQFWPSTIFSISFHRRQNVYLRSTC